MKGDFHTHSKASDGDFNLNDLITRAIDNKLTHMALTDHNVYNLIEIDKSNLDTKGVTIIPSVEFDVERNIDCGSKMHILGLNIDVNNKKLNKYFEWYHNRNLKIVRKFYNKLHKIYGLNVKPSSVDRSSKLSYWGIATKFAYKMIQQGLSQKSLYDVGDEIRVYLSKKKFDFHNEKKVFKLIKEAGGIPVLAHPCSLKLSDEDLEKRIKYLKTLGLQAIEIYHPKITAEQSKFYQSLADKYEFYTSGGSDFHRYGERPDVFVSDSGKNKVTIMQLLNNIKPL